MRPDRRRPRALARAVVSLVHGEAEATRCEKASEALFTEEIAGLSEDMLLAVTEDAPSRELSRAELSHGGLSLVDLLWRRAAWPSRGRGPAHDRAGRRDVNNVQQSDAARVLGPDDLLHDR